MADEKESFEALGVQNPKLAEEEEGEGDEEEEVGEFEKLSESGKLCELGVPPSAVELGEAQLGTLALPSSLPSENDQFGVLEVNSASGTLGGVEFKEQVGVPHQEVLVSVTSQAPQAQTQNQLQSSVSPSSSSEQSPTSVTQYAPSPTQLEHKPSSPKVNTNLCIPEVDQKNCSDLKTLSVVPMVNSPASDGFNWRKYGQKLVKSPRGSRSYYKCTYSDCCAKKIDFCDHSGCVIEIVYKGQHNHDPPRKVNCTRESRLTSSSGPVVGNNVSEHPIRMLNNSDPSTSSKEPIQETPPISERKRQHWSASDGNGEITVKEEHVNEAEPKRRLKKSNLSHSCSVLKPGKKPKFVVHVAGDVGISGDGYRWRKYGQKMVKGNPHPRNYYRCTSAGCPVRKHIEAAIDDTSAVIITYKGVHDHDMPVPKKRHGPPSAPLVAATAAATSSMNKVQLKKTDAFKNQTSSTEWSVDTEGELTGVASDLGGEKAMESARTLLSIGFEIKPC